MACGLWFVVCTVSLSISSSDSLQVRWQRRCDAVVTRATMSPFTHPHQHLHPPTAPRCSLPHLPNNCRLLRSADYICLYNAILFSLTIIKAFYSNWALYQRVQAVFYLAQAVVQLLFIYLRPHIYQRYRFQVRRNGGLLCVALHSCSCSCRPSAI